MTRFAYRNRISVMRSRRISIKKYLKESFVSLNNLVFGIIILIIFFLGLNHYLDLQLASNTVKVTATPTAEDSFPVETLDLKNTSWISNTFSGSITNNGKKDVFNIKVRLAVSKTREKWDPEEQVVIVPYEIQSGKTIFFSESVTPAKSNDPWWTSNIIDAKYYNGEDIPTPTPTVYVPPTAMPTYKPVPTIDPNPPVLCNVSPNCGGGTTPLRQSECNNSTCCQIGDKWIFYKDKVQCGRDQASQGKAPAPVVNNNQQSAGNNIYCWSNAYGYGYYTSSGDQCNLDNLKSTTYKICQDIQKMKVDTCDSGCNGLSVGDGGSNDPFADCLGKCTDQYKIDLTQCHL